MKTRLDYILNLVNRRWFNSLLVSTDPPEISESVLWLRRCKNVSTVNGGVSHVVGHHSIQLLLESLHRI